jgi:hypothetical protein
MQHLERHRRADGQCGLLQPFARLGPSAHAPVSRSPSLSSVRKPLALDVYQPRRQAPSDELIGGFNRLCRSGRLGVLSRRQGWWKGGWCKSRQAIEISDHRREPLISEVRDA